MLGRGKDSDLWLGGHRYWLRGFDHGATCGAPQRELVIGNDLNGHEFHELLHAAFAQEGLQKNGRREPREDLGSEAAGEESAACGLHFQRQIASFGSEYGNENVEGLGTHGTFACHCSLRNSRGGVRHEHLLGQPLRHFAFSSVAQEFEYVERAGARENTLVADVAVTGVQVTVEFDLQLILRTEVGMAAFGGEKVVAFAVPEKAAFAEAGAGGNDAVVPGSLGGNAVQWNPILAGQSGDSPAGGLEVVDQSCVLEIEFVSEAARFDGPRKIRSLNPAIVDGAGDTETSPERPNARSADKLGDDLIQAGIPPAGENGCCYQIELAILYIKEGQSCVGASDGARQDHLSVSLQCRPSRSISSSDSFGPQLPAG